MPKVYRIYFIGIGGIGMSALARYFLSEGYRVAGSDISSSSITEELKKEGMMINIGKHSANNLKNPDLVIYNQAIDFKKNPEFKKAQKLKIPCLSYPAALGKLTEKYQTIAIAGSHGKSTTTAMISLILIAAGWDPTVIIGTKLKEFGPPASGKNFRKGKGKWLVIEADEWHASFLHYSPVLGVITNIDKEHLDFYKNFIGVKKAFEQFKNNCQFVVKWSKNPLIKKEVKKILRVPGEHNINNALAASAVAQYLGISKKIILKALSKFQGSWRRMEYRGELKIKGKKLKVSVYDDYAHHPTEIKATLAAFRQEWPKNAIICVFQPHQAQRLKLLFNDFKKAFKDADKAVLLPVYEVAGREKQAKSADWRIKTENLSQKLSKIIDAHYIKNPKKDLKPILKSLITHYQLPTIVVMMGAGDIVKYTPLLLK